MTSRRFAILLLLLAASASRGQWVEDSVDCGGWYVYSLAYNSRENVVYGASQDGYFFTISCDSNRIISSFGLREASWVEYDSVRNRAYCVYGDGVAVIDGTGHQLLDTILFAGGGTSAHDETNDRLYVSRGDYDAVAVIDCRGDSLLRMISVAGYPTWLVTNPIRRKLYVLNSDGGTVTIVDMNADTVLRTIPLGDFPMCACYCPSHDKVYCARVGGMVVISGSADSVIGFVTLPQSTYYESTIWVPSSDAVLTCGYTGTQDSVFTIDPLLDVVSARVRVVRGPQCLAWASWSSHVFCASMSGVVSVLPEDGGTVLATLAVGSYPASFAVSPVAGRVYVGHSNTSFVYVIRDTGLSVAERPPVGRSPLVQASPNPFRRKLALRVVRESGHLSAFRIISATGQQVRRIPFVADETVIWDGRDAAGVEVPRGVYYVCAERQREASRLKVVKLH